MRQQNDLGYLPRVYSGEINRRHKQTFACPCAAVPLLGHTVAGGRRAMHRAQDPCGKLPGTGPVIAISWRQETPNVPDQDMDFFHVIRSLHRGQVRPSSRNRPPKVRRSSAF